MRRLERGPKPSILEKYADAWTRQYVAEQAAKPEKRPRDNRYGHDEVRLELRRMSSSKCFYCEAGLAETEQEVDHYLEVAERPDLAFEWTNLYLACRGCNKKKASNLRCPVTKCIDPCGTALDPAEHLAYRKNEIMPRGDSERGRETIKKYALDRDDLQHARLLALLALERAVRVVREAQIARGGGPPRPTELEWLRGFADPSRPFSSMLREALRGLLETP